MLIGAIIALTHFKGLFCNVISLFPICVEGNCFSWSPCQILLRLITEYYGGHFAATLQCRPSLHFKALWFRSSIESLPSWKALFADSFNFPFVFVTRQQQHVCAHQFVSV